ncbi:MAG TPA: glycosyltransferase family 9 protein [Candidatus Omnitrophota bacterium]|nr:MAG: ADP-heptose--LPS heptosyltransferase 2 [Candidatus Omnitrophica bacterium ADurb.Bin314]HOE68208.1 glycosyltransferase family 9 protein [Candidatus Omnitrophota bacterium]HQB94066.1 glycosyltransferase family 9 protein [Candidatus Omnitrophota bacterium]
MKILVVMKNWLGDLLFQMPALEVIKSRYPGAEIFCVAPERCRAILEAHPAVAGFLPFDEKSTHRSWFSRAGFVFRLRKLGPWDEGYLFHRSRSRAVMLCLAGVKKRTGYGKGRSLFLTTAVREPDGKLHQLDYFMTLMKGAGYETPIEPKSRFYFTPGDDREAREVLRQNGLTDGARYVCFHLGANWKPKRWPVEHFAVLASMVHAKWKIPIVVTGSAGDRTLFMDFLKSLRRLGAPGADELRVIDLVGKTPLRVSACIYKHATCLVTGDSGPMHIASGVGARVAAIFGPTDPDLTGPRGVGESIVLQYVPPGYSIPFFGKDLPGDGWLSGITPDEVFEAVQQLGAFPDGSGS